MDLKIKKLKVGEVGTNCYIGSLPNGEAFVVDPGDEAARIIEKLEQIKGVNVRYILLTHGHYDHALAVDDLAIKYPNASIIVHEADVKLFKDLAAQGLYIAKRFHNPRAEVVAVSEGSTLKFGDDIIHVLHTPGHTRGSVCFRLGNRLFSGDTIFYHTYGRIDLPWSQPEKMKESLDKVLNLNEDFEVLPGHGRETTIAEEKNFSSSAF